jgi:DNA-binding SARP family transcriptional activator
VLEFRVLGPLEVVGDTGALLLGGPKRRSVLAILLLNANRVVSIDRLADDVYGEASPATVVTQLQGHVSQLRRLLDPDHRAGEPGSLIETREPGYLIRIAPEQIDLHRFERWTEEAARSLARGDADKAAARLREALGLWRGPALADLAYEPFAQTAIARLDELRLAALEQRIEADLRMGRHVEVVPELEALVGEHPFQEHLRGHLMLALYRSGRQTDALAAFRDGRSALVGAFGVEPTPALQELERAILRQDPTLDLVPVAAAALAPARTILVGPRGNDPEPLLALARAVAGRPDRELIVARLVEDERELERATAEASAWRRALPAGARAAAFTSREPAADIVRLADAYEVELVLLDAGSRELDGALADELAAIFTHAAADAAVLVGSRPDLESGRGVDVPFGGGEHDWAALELAAWLASRAGVPLRLLGTAARAGTGRRDASRLLADASLAVQRVVGVEAEPVLADPTEDALVEAIQSASLVIVGIAPRWRTEGIGRIRRALVRDARAPVLLVRRGVRPGGLAPREGRTRFSWSIEG